MNEKELQALLNKTKERIAKIELQATEVFSKKTGFSVGSIIRFKTQPEFTAKITSFQWVDYSLHVYFEVYRNDKKLIMYSDNQEVSIFIQRFELVHVGVL